jgi:hypothetical protein
MSSEQDIKHAEGEGWLTAPMECVICEHKWVQVGPIYIQKYECGKCGHLNDIPPFEDEL